ncbi:MAG: hypothetical protein QOI20_1533, partial [Acidimicrobiaceae bacterium]|nr:hypothetical protein [Acidimicrobiaceae bacterium]
LNNTGTLLVDGEGGIDGPPHVISGSITNLGLFDLKSGQTHFNGPGSLVNGGSVVVEPNARLFVHNGVSIANVHGNMAVDGTLQSESSFTEGAGSTSGLHPVTVSSGSLNYTGAGPSEFFVPANTSITLTGDLSPGQHLEINGLDSCGGGFPATATGASSFTNGGTITIHHESSCAGGVATLAVAPGGVITNTGTIEADTEGGPTALTGDVDNQGALNVLSGVFTMNGVITNAGTVNVAAAATLNATSLTQTPTGRFNVNINGAPNTNAFSHLNFTDPVVLDGFVNVLQASNYAAVDGDAFPFLTHPSETGTFRRVHGQVTPTQAFAAAYAPTHDDLVVGPSDLHVALSAHDVTAPAAAVGPGHQVTADFQVTSSGPDTAPNPWTDSIYISSDTVFDPADVLLQRVEHQTDLDANASYAVPIGAFLPALAPGQYHLIVVPDSGGRVSFSALNTNGVSPAFDVIEPPLLTPGTPISTTVAKGQDAYYRLNVTSIDDITVTLTPSVDGSVDLLAAAARFATPADHDRLSSKAVGPESFIATQSKAGVWFIDLHGNASAGAIPGSNVVLSAAESGLTVSRTTPSSGSNKGQVTIDLEGSDFGPDLVLKLAQSGTPMRTATSVARTDSTIAFGTFDLQGLAVGVYDLVLASEGRTFTKPSAFTVNDGPGGQLRLNATAPDSIRFGWPGSVDVTLTNTGGTDVLVPIVRLTATLNDVVAPPGSTEFGPSADVVDPDFASGSSSPLPRSVLPPGQSSTLHFQVKSTSNEAHSRLNTQAQAVSTAATTPIDWPSQLASAQPTGLSNSAWSTVVASLASLLGPTQDAYAKRLVQTITEADQFDVAFKNEAQVLDYIVQRQLATDPAAPVSGTLYLDDTSHPLSRVAMSLGDPGGDSLLNAISWYDGRFAFWDVPASPQPLHAAGYLPRPAVVVDPSPTATGLSVVVDPGATVTGTVLGSGAPVADAVVSVADGAGSVQSAPTGADGAYTVTGLAPGSVTAQATGPGFLASGPASASVTLVGPNALDLSLTTGGTITGTITDVGGTDPPPAGTTVKANPTDHSGPPIAGTVKADGTYTIAGLPALAGPDPHSYTVTAEAPDHGSASHSGVLAALDATTSGVDIELATAGSLAGHVTDAETGLPIQGVVVSTDGPGTHKPTTTNLTGDYTLAGLPAGPQHVLFSPPDREHIPLNLPVTVNGGAPPTVQDAAIAPSGTVAINVQNTAGDPLPQQALALISPVHTNADGEYVQGLATDAGGHATASRLLPGSYEVQVLGADVHVPFSISGGAPHPAVTVTVPAGLLQGTVRHTDNSPAAGVAVAVSDAQRQVMTTTTDADGHYALRVNGAQTLDVVATGKGFGLTMALAQTVPADGTTTVDLSPGTGSLTVTVTSGGKPVKDAWVSAFSGPANVQPAAVDAESGADGVAVLNGLSPGTYRVTVATPGRGTTSQSVVVNAGNNPLPVSMGLAGSIAGRVTHAGGDVSNAIVRVGSASGLAKSAVTDGTGHYTVNDLAPGDYDVSVVDGADAPARFTGVAVLAGGTTVRDATLSTAGSTLTVLLQSGPGGLPGRELAVFDASGAQVAGGALGPAASSASPATTLVAGPLADGTYTVVVSGPGAATAKQVVVLPAAGPIAVAAPAGEVLFAGPQVASQFPSAASVSGALKALGAVRPRAAADTPQITVSGADLVASWLGGDLFPPPRQSVLEPFETQRFHHALAMSIDPKCPDYARLKAMQDQLKHLFRAMVESFDAWLLAYQSMKETGSADLIIAANNIIQVANAGIQTAVSLSGPAASMLAQLDN